MPILIDHDVRGNQVRVVARGKLTDADYEWFVPQIEELMKRRGRLRLMWVMEGFRGWDLHGLWDDLKFGLKHRDDFERIAVVGERPWQKWATQCFKPVTPCQVSYFEHGREDDARAWIHGN